MKSILWLVIILSFLVLQCDNGIVTQIEDVDITQSLGKVSLNLDLTNAPNEVVFLSGQLERVNHDTIFFEFKINENVATASIENIFHGDWELRINAYNNENLIIYSGSTIVTIIPHSTVNVNLHLEPTTGSLMITVTWGDSNENPPDSLLACYPFNGNVNDESLNDFHGEVFGSTLTNDRYDNHNSAYLFSGINDYIFLPPEINLSNSLQFSISVWVNLNSYPQGASPQQSNAPREFGILDFSYGNGDDYQHLFIGIRPNDDPRGHDNEVIFYERDIDSNIVRLYGNTPVLNTWYHIVAIRNKNNFQLCINGQVLDEAIDNNLTKFTSNTINIGRAYDNKRFQHYFDGIIDDIRIYNRALTPNEVRILFKELK